MHFLGTVSLLFALTGLSVQQTSIDPTSVPISQREYWCQSQKTQCPLICLQLPGAKGDPQHNTCVASSLSYSCVCSNGQQPNATEYSQTIPYFICTEWGNRCVAACGSNNICADRCRSDHPCGATNPKQVAVPTTTSTDSPAATTHKIKGALTPTNNPAPHAAVLPFTWSQNYFASPIVVIGLFAAGFTLLL